MAIDSEFTGDDDGPLVSLDEISYEACGEQARSLLYYLTATKEECDYMDSANRERWEDVVRVVVDVCLRQIECRWLDLAGRCFEAYHGRNLVGEPYPMQLIWEAITRHLVNVVTAGEEEDRRHLYFQFDRWAEWLINKLQKEKV